MIINDLWLLSAAIHDEVSEDLTPFTEEDLALMYVNPQLVANQEFVENFIRVSQHACTWDTIHCIPTHTIIMQLAWDHPFVTGAHEILYCF